ncbi:MAG TPA: hypothetical protein VFJ50_11320 [Gemmatimonadales bacterium]|nr:hypothetical protein [Gemmatimonadales bacterium]
MRTAPAATPGLDEVEAATGLAVAEVAVAEVTVIAGAAASVRVVVVAGPIGAAAVGFALLACAVGRGVGRAVGLAVAPVVASHPTSSADATSLSGVAAC